jgi:hypothetical protein
MPVREFNNAARAWVFFHRIFDRVNVSVSCAFEPRGVHAQHHLDAMSALFRDPEQILSQHELPGHRGMARVIGSAPSNIERLDALGVADRPSVFEKE